MSAAQTYVSVELPDNPPTMNAQPLLKPQADEAVEAQPWLYRSEGFAEDLPDWDDAPAAPSEALVHGLAGWLMGAPLALALVGVVSSVAVFA